MRQAKSFALIAATCFSLASPLTQAAQMSVTWNDAVGDFSPVGDVVSARLSFDSLTGAWTASWWADAAHPFTGNARFNLNLFDIALGNPATATAPQVSLDDIHHFGSATATFYSYSGITPYLQNWHAGDLVTTGNNTNFLSGVVNMDTPFNRDNMVTTAPIIQSVPEPAGLALCASGLILLGAVRRRNV